MRPSIGKPDRRKCATTLTCAYWRATLRSVQTLKRDPKTINQTVQIMMLGFGVCLGATTLQAGGAMVSGPAVPGGHINLGKGVTLTNLQQDPMGGLAGQWTVKEIAFAELPPQAKVTLNFANGTMFGLAACNTYEANIDVENGTFNLGPVTLNSDLCDSELMEAEVNFMRVLERSNRFEIATDGELTLFAQEFMMLKAHR